MAVAVGGARKSACEAARRDQDQGQAVFLCLVSEDGDLSSSSSSISDEDRSQRRTNQRLIITIQMNVHSCIAAYSARAPMLHAPILCRVAARYLLNSPLQSPGWKYSHVAGRRVCWRPCHVAVLEWRHVVTCNTV